VHRLLPALTPVLAAGHALGARGQRRLRLAIVTGGATTTPWAVTRKTFTPTAIPVSWPVGGSGCVGTSAQERQAYQPSASRAMVTVFGVPANGRCNRIGNRIGRRPSFERRSTPPSTAAPPPECGEVKAWERRRPWKRGSPGVSPAWMRRKNA
jgi:hypothetical protein